MDFIQKVEISFENSKRLIEQNARIDLKIERLLEEGFRQERKQVCSAINKAVFDMAEKQGISVYDICYHFMPDERIVYPEPPYQTENLSKITIKNEIRLVPMVFNLEQGPGYWKQKYYNLKKKMRELIDDKSI